ncbi:MAG TPA: VIT domain-containing protein, partial [Symbiobacteriaceae bacterium]|nr:VIT domain-containing protein [Symbiobacteriaceae bacterium]
MLVSLLALLSVFLAAAPAMAHDIIPILPPERRGGPPAIQLQSLQAEVAVSENVARITLDQVFVNRTPGPAEGTYMFPLPPGASLSSFQMFVDGQAYTAEVLKADEARAIYESIVRRNRDPALLQYVGQGLLQARVFPIPPGQERRIRVQYEQVLPKDGGLSELRIPMSREPIPEVSVAVEIRGESVGQVYSPTHSVSVSKGTDGSVSAGLEGRQLQGDFRLFFGAESDSVGVQLLTYKTSGEDGYFLLLVDPPTRAEESERVAQDVLLVLDLSGSMSGEKFEQAKGAALQILGSLGQDDRFAVVGFHSGTVTYADELRGYGEVKEAMDYVRSLQLGGATNISEAMAQAQAIAGPAGGRPQTIVLITDGQPTAGEREPSRIVEAVRAKATASQRIFTFGVGYDVNTVLLDAMAQENRGRSDYVKPGENLESAVAAFWRKVGQPVLADVTLQFSGIKAEEVYPRPLPDLYLGSQMVVLGRYRQGGDARLTLQGTVNGTARSYTFDDLSFATRDTSRDYVPRLWASRKVGYLLGEIRRNGSNQELIDEVVALSQRYGIA